MELQETHIHRMFSTLADMAVRVDPKKFIIGVSCVGFGELCVNDPNIQEVRFHTHSRSYKIVPINGLEEGQTALIF